MTPQLAVSVLTAACVGVLFAVLTLLYRRGRVANPLETALFGVMTLLIVGAVAARLLPVPLRHAAGEGVAAALALLIVATVVITHRRFRGRRTEGGGSGKS